MMKVVLAIVLLAATACATVKPEPRTGKIPNVPVEKRDCNSPLGLIPDGQTASGYLNPVEEGGRSCQKGTLTCFDGEWSGPYVHLTCEEAPAAP